MIEERLIENASLYALGALEGSEAREFEGLLRENAELRQLVSDLADASRALAGTVPLVEPPAGLRERILAPAGAKAVVLPLPGRSAWMGWAPLALAAGLAVVCAVLVQQGARQTNALEQLTAQYKVETNELTRDIRELQPTNLLSNIRVAVLSSQVPDMPNSVAVSLWDNQAQSGTFIGHGLKPLATDQDYQLWIIDPKAAGPVDAGVFQVDKDGNVRIPFTARQHIQEAKQFAVSLEPKGGKPVPTKVVMAGG